MRRVDLKGPLLVGMLAVAGLLTAFWMGSRLGFVGYILGLPMGAAVMLGILSCVSLRWTYFQGILWRGVPAFPVCRSGCCRGSGLSDLGDYTVVWNNDWTVRGVRCRCGVTYKKIGRRFVELGEDGSMKPYLIWRRFKGWCPDLPPAG